MCAESPGTTVIPGDGATGDQGSQNRPIRQWRLCATALRAALIPETSAISGGRKRDQAHDLPWPSVARRPRRGRRPPVPERPQQRAVKLSGLSKSFAQCRRPRRRVMSMPELMMLECDWAETPANVKVAAAGPLRAAMAGTGTCPVLAETVAAAGGAAGESGRGGWLASAASGG